jgi:shikimate kinase
MTLAKGHSSDMEAPIKAGRVSDIDKRKGEWLFVDIGFSQVKQSCGVLKDAEQPYTVTFRKLVNLVIKEATKKTSKRLNLVLEAPLSVTFNKDRNPTARSCDRRGGTRRDWYHNGAALLSMTAAGHLLSEMEKKKSRIQREVRLFEGFVSFKPKDSTPDHKKDVQKLRDAVWNPTPICILAPKQLKRDKSDRIESAFKFAGMDYRIPPVILPTNIILVGFMASGKSHVGRILSERTGTPMVDTDSMIVERAGKSIDRIFAEEGEATFRTLEREVIAELCQGSGQIISAGGGAFVDPDNRRVMLSGGTVFCLQAQPETIYRRLTSDNDTGQAVRPLLAGDDPLGRIQELLAQRADAYGQAHYRIDTDALTPEEVAKGVLATFIPRGE